MLVAVPNDGVHVVLYMHDGLEHSSPHADLWSAWISDGCMDDVMKFASQISNRHIEIPPISINNMYSANYWENKQLLIMTISNICILMDISMVYSLSTHTVEPLLKDTSEIRTPLY